MASFDSSDASASSTRAHSTALPDTATRNGVEIRFSALGARDAVSLSEVWSLNGWTIQFARLGASQKLDLDQSAGRIHVKVITGEIANLGRQAFPPRGTAADTLVAEDRLEAGVNGASVAILTETRAVPASIRSMDQLVFEGPLSEVFVWKSFSQLYSSFTDLFDGVEAYRSPGFLLRETDGTELAYVGIWTAGKGADLSAHNHGGRPTSEVPAFAEVHWVLDNGTGKGGMYACERREATVRERLPLQRGQEHGPFFEVEPRTGSPARKENGAVRYGWHSWEAGDDGSEGQAFDCVVAFEINPELVKI